MPCLIGRSLFVWGSCVSQIVTKWHEGFEPHQQCDLGQKLCFTRYQLYLLKGWKPRSIMWAVTCVYMMESYKRLWTPRSGWVSLVDNTQCVLSHINTRKVTWSWLYGGRTIEAPCLELFLDAAPCSSLGWF